MRDKGRRRNKGKSGFNRRRIIIACMGAVIVFIGLAVYGKTRGQKITFGEYDIRVKGNKYSDETRTGTIDLTIKNNGDQTEKLFYTSEDILHNGLDAIVDDEYFLQIVQSDIKFVSRAYEIKYNRKTQHLRIYYINPDKDEPAQKKVQLEIVKSKDKKTEKEIEIHLNKEKEYLVSEGGAMNGITISSTGIKYSNGPLFNEPYSTSSTLTATYGEEKYIVALNYDISPETLAEQNIIKPKVTYSDEGYSGYKILAIELENWQDIETAVLEDMTFWF